MLEVDALLRDGDADGPLLVTVADYKRMVGFDVAAACMPVLRAARRTEVHDGVEYLAFPLWERVVSERGQPATTSPSMGFTVQPRLARYAIARVAGVARPGELEDDPTRLFLDVGAPDVRHDVELA